MIIIIIINLGKFNLLNYGILLYIYIKDQLIYAYFENRVEW